MPTTDEVRKLLYDLCVKYGFCLPPAEQEKLTNDPPDTVDGFTDAVYRAEGMDPHDARPSAQRLREVVRAHVAETFGTER